MSRALDILQMKEEDLLKLLAAETHLGGTNLDFQMEQYIRYRKNDGIYIIIWREHERIFCFQLMPLLPMENLADVSVTFSRNTGQWAVLKFAAASGAR